MRTVEEVWSGVGFAVEQGEQQRMTPEGLPLMKPDGTPDMEATTVLMFVDQSPGEQRVLRVPFNDEGKAKLIQALSGGLVIAKGLSGLGL